METRYKISARSVLRMQQLWAHYAGAQEAAEASAQIAANAGATYTSALELLAESLGIDPSTDLTTVRIEFAAAEFIIATADPAPTPAPAPAHVPLTPPTLNGETVGTEAPVHRDDAQSRDW